MYGNSWHLQDETDDMRVVDCANGTKRIEAVTLSRRMCAL